MDVKRYINTRIWSDTWFEELDGIERLVWLYLLTNQQTNLIGIYEIGIRRISNESGVEFNRLQTVMERFKNDSKAFHNGRFVIIPNYLKNQNLANPNMKKSARNLFDSLPEDVKKVLLSIGIADFDVLKNGLPNGLQTVSKPLPNPSISEREREREIESEIEKEDEGGKVVALESAAPPDISNSRMSVRNFIDPLSEQVENEKEKVPPKRKGQKPEPEIPELEEFMLYAKKWMEDNAKDYPGKRAQLISKYETWKTAGWKDGFGNQIKDWKGKIRNTEPHLPADANFNRNTRQEAREPQPGRPFGKL